MHSLFLSSLSPSFFPFNVRQVRPLFHGKSPELGILYRRSGGRERGSFLDETIQIERREIRLPYNMFFFIIKTITSDTKYHIYECHLHDSSINYVNDCQGRIFTHTYSVFSLEQKPDRGVVTRITAKYCSLFYDSLSIKFWQSTIIIACFICLSRIEQDFLTFSLLHFYTK